MEDSLRKIADFSTKVDEREAGLIPLRAELAELEERYRTAKESHVGLAHAIYVRKLTGHS